jgi:hypothetical protein
MTYYTAIKRMLKELGPQIPKECIPVVTRYMQMMYCIGFDERTKGNSKAVIQLDQYGNVLNEFESSAFASRLTGANESTIRACCKGRRNKAGGFHWKYKNVA